MAETIGPTTRYYFPEEGAPFGEFNFLRGDHRKQTNSDYMDSTLKVASGGIVADAWLNSEWITELVDDRKLEELRGEVRPPFAMSATYGAIHSFHYPEQHVSWFAVRPPSLHELRPLTLPRKGLSVTGLLPGQVVGFASAKHDVSGNWLQKTIKRHFHPEKVYACISDVDVRKQYQGKKIGAALFYFGLADFKPDQVPTTYTGAVNLSLIKKLSEFGYKVTGSHIRADLIPGTSIEEVRLQADRIAAVRERMVSKFPWLDNAVPMDA